MEIQSNFIKTIMEEDLRSGKHNTLSLAFHQNQMGFYISDMLVRL